MIPEDGGIPEEIIELNDQFLPPQRLEEVELVFRRMREDPRLELMLAVLEVRLNDRPLSASTRPSRGLLRKLLQALDQEEGESLLYGSPYNQLGAAVAEQTDLRFEWWDFDLGDRLWEWPGLPSIRAFLEHGTGCGPQRSGTEAQALHDTLLHGLVGDSTTFAVFGCTHVRTPGKPQAPASVTHEGIWPATEVSPWFHGVFWDDLLFILNPPESALIVLAVTSA